MHFSTVRKRFPLELPEHVPGVVRAPSTGQG
jgi:hypothetical protein